LRQVQKYSHSVGTEIMGASGRLGGRRWDDALVDHARPSAPARAARRSRKETLPATGIAGEGRTTPGGGGGWFGHCCIPSVICEGEGPPATERNGKHPAAPAGGTFWSYFGFDAREKTISIKAGRAGPSIVGRDNSV